MLYFPNPFDALINNTQCLGQASGILGVGEREKGGMFIVIKPRL